MAATAPVNPGSSGERGRAARGPSWRASMSEAALAHPDRRRRLRVAGLQPRGRLAGPVWPIAALRDDALDTDPAGVIERDLPRPVEMVDVAEARPRPSQEPR